MSEVILVADENVDHGAINALRAKGYRVVAISEELAGEKDEIVLRRARELRAVLLTFDKDFGELMFKRGHAAPRSVLFLRTIPSSSQEMFNVFDGLLTGQVAGDVMGYFVVWTRDGTRKRLFPHSS